MLGGDISIPVFNKTLPVSSGKPAARMYAAHFFSHWSGYLV
jgi:hypothetical protein